MLFNDIEHATDLDARYIVLSYLKQYYEQEDTAQIWAVESALVFASCSYAGLPPGSTWYDRVVSENSGEDLLGLLRYRLRKPITLDLSGDDFW